MNAKKKNIQGTVISNAMQKTIVVEEEHVKIHPKYHKRFVRNKRYKVHVNDSSIYSIGEKVEFYECRPISKDKRWKAVEKKQNKQ